MCMSSEKFTRRTLLRTSAAGAAGLAFGLGGVQRAFAGDLTIGIVYVGARDDFGWNQAHAVAMASLKNCQA
jgi:simple sugar transport system substrate-binding protein